MKKLFTPFIAAILSLTGIGANAQCTIDTTNTTPGINNSVPCITQGVAYGQALQFYVWSSYFGHHVDSLIIDSIVGLPAGMSLAINPIYGDTIGGHHGCFWLSGTTNAAVGRYPVTFYGRAYSDTNKYQIHDFFSYLVEVCTPVSSSCDTILNFHAGESAAVYAIAGTTGYVGGADGLGDTEKAEEFTGTKGAQVTAAVLGFGLAVIAPADSNKNITIYVYDDTGIDGFGNPGAPGNVIDSATLKLAEIALAVAFRSGLAVTFSNPPNLPGSSFFISVLEPTNGDTVVLYTNAQHSVDGRGWANLYGSWYAYNDSFFTYPQYHMGNYIQAFLCGGAPAPNFAAAPLSNCGPVTVHFTDESRFTPKKWNWAFSHGTPASDTTQNPVVTYDSSGVYAVTLISSNQLGADTVTKIESIVIYSNSFTDSIATTEASTASSADGSARVVSVTGGTGPYKYRWNNGDSLATNNGLLPGVYIVTITDANGCHTMDTLTVGFVNGIAGISDKQVKIYPNPASDVLNIQWSSNIEAEITLTDLNGRELKAFASTGLTSALDVKDLASGVYLLKIKDKQTQQQTAVRFAKF